MVALKKFSLRKKKAPEDEAEIGVHNAKGATKRSISPVSRIQKSLEASKKFLRPPSNPKSKTRALQLRYPSRILYKRSKNKTRKSRRNSDTASETDLHYSSSLPSVSSATESVTDSIAETVDFDYVYEEKVVVEERDHGLEERDDVPNECEDTEARLLNRDVGLDTVEDQCVVGSEAASSLEQEERLVSENTPVENASSRWPYVAAATALVAVVAIKLASPKSFK